MERNKKGDIENKTSQRAVKFWKGPVHFVSRRGFQANIGKQFKWSGLLVPLVSSERCERPKCCGLNLRERMGMEYSALSSSLALKGKKHRGTTV